MPTSREVRTRAAVINAKQLVTNPSVVTRTVVDEHTITRARPRLVTRTVTHSVTQVTPPVTVTAPPITITETLPPQTVTVTTTIKHGH